MIYCLVFIKLYFNFLLLGQKSYEHILVFHCKLVLARWVFMEVIQVSCSPGSDQHLTHFFPSYTTLQANDEVATIHDQTSISLRDYMGWGLELDHEVT